MDKKTARYIYLQWSHVLSNVESGGRRFYRSDDLSLQWSHVLSNVERAGIRTLSNTQSYSTDFE